jgi:hypothetical protein
MLNVKRRTPWLEPSDTPTIRAWCEMELVVGSAIFNELVDHGVISEKGALRTDLLKSRAHLPHSSACL